MLNSLKLIPLCQSIGDAISSTLEVQEQEKCVENVVKRTKMDIDATTINEKELLGGTQIGKMDLPPLGTHWRQWQETYLHC